MKPIRTTAATIGSIGIVVAASWLAFPAFTEGTIAQIEDRLSNVFAPNCETDPVVCLKSKSENLTMLERGIDEARGTLENSIGQTEEVVVSNRTLVGLNELYLEQGRNLLLSHQGGSIRFAGVEYPEKDIFERQLELYFLEGQRLKEALLESEDQLARLVDARQILLSRRSEIRATLSIIPSKIALAQTKVTFDAIEQDLAAIDSVLLFGTADKSRVDDLLRTTAETAKSSETPTVMSDAFRTWLGEGLTN